MHVRYGMSIVLLLTHLYRANLETTAEVTTVKSCCFMSLVLEDLSNISNHKKIKWGDILAFAKGFQWTSINST